MTRVIVPRSHESSWRGPPVPRTRAAAADVPPAPVLVITPDDIRKYMAAVDESWKSLDNDRRAKIVWASPDALESAAKTVRSFAPSYADELESDAKVLRARMIGRSFDQVAKEIAWGTKFLELSTRWNTLKSETGYPGSFKSYGGTTWVVGKWPAIRGIHEELNAMHDSLIMLGIEPSMPKKDLPGPLGVPDASTTLKIAIPTIAVLLVGSAVAYMVLKP